VITPDAVIEQELTTLIFPFELLRVLIFDVVALKVLKPPVKHRTLVDDIFEEFKLVVVIVPLFKIPIYPLDEST